jgi:hypothetical protein
MLKQLPIKKGYLLIAGAMVLLLLSYQLAIKKTIEAWQVNRQLNAQLEQAVGLSYQPAYLERKDANLTALIKQYQTDTVAFRSNAISAIAAVAEKEQVKLSEVPLQDPLFHTGQFNVQKLDFEGSFFALTRVLDKLQRTAGIGTVRSATYKLSVTRANGDEIKKLVLEVYLETVKQGFN